MATATIELKFLAGDNIESAFKEAIRIASVLEVWVEFKFNGVTCLANSLSTVKHGVKAYHDALKSGGSSLYTVA